VRERQDVSRKAREDLLDVLLPVIDHLELALGAAEEHGPDDAFVEGVKLVADQLMGVLSGFGLKSVDAQGKEFDHSVHEAVSTIQSDDVPEHVVVHQIRRGYLLDDRLLRPAQVVVSSGSENSASPDDGGSDG
jgi:molecular chaperone GrpE